MILIWTNTGEWGGVTVLTMRFAQFLRERGIRFAIVEPAGSRLRTELDWADYLTPEEAGRHAGQVDHLFFPSISGFRDGSVPWDALERASVFGWIVQPLDPLSCFVPTASPLVARFGAKAIKPVLMLWRRHVRLVTRLFATLVQGDALAVMDVTAANAFSYYYPTVPRPRLTVPIPAPVPSAAAGPRRRYEPGRLVVGYLGRMDAVKFTGVGAFVTHSLAEMARHTPVELVAVTEGSHVPDLEKACREAGVRLRLTGYLPNEEARRLIRSETDVAVAMGTSALDMAASGHPCVIIDTALSARSRPQTRFRFIHESAQYNLGEYRDFPIYVGGSHSFPEIVAMLDEDMEQASIEYVRHEHDPQRAFASLLTGIRASRVRVGDVARDALGITLSIRSINRLYGWLRRG